MDDNIKDCIRSASLFLLQRSMCRLIYAHTHTVLIPTNWTNKCMAKKGLCCFLLRHCSCLCLSLLIRPFHLVCIDYRLTSHSDTLRGPIHVCSPRDTHWVHCGEECLLSWPELACESMSIIPSQWVLHNTAAAIPPTRPLGPILHSSKEKWLGWLKERTVEWMK